MSDIDDVLKQFEKDIKDITKLGNSLLRVRKDDDTIDIEKLQKKVTHYLNKQTPKKDGH